MCIIGFIISTITSGRHIKLEKLFLTKIKMRQHGIVQMTFILYIMNRNYFSLVPISLKDALLNLHDIMYNLNVSSHGHLRPTNREILRVQLCIANVFSCRFYIWLHTIAQRYDGGSESSISYLYFHMR